MKVNVADRVEVSQNQVNGENSRSRPRAVMGEDELDKVATERWRGMRNEKACTWMQNVWKLGGAMIKIRE